MTGGYQTRFTDEIRAAAKAARDAEVGRCVKAFEGDDSATWLALNERYRPSIIEASKRVCKAHGTHPRRQAWYRDSKKCGCSDAEYGQAMLHGSRRGK